MRGQIESKNAEMKQAHGMQKAKYVGLFGMKIQTFLTTIAGKDNLDFMFNEGITPTIPLNPQVLHDRTDTGVHQRCRRYAMPRRTYEYTQGTPRKEK
jgi:hypothetical protein